VQAVVIAAGEGRRLRPLTESYAKAVLPIDGRPVIVFVLRELVHAGARPITIVIGHLGDQVRRLLEGFDAELRLAVQPEPLGSADAILRAGAEPPFLVLAADTLFVRGDVARFASAAEGFDGALAVRRDPPPDPKQRRAVRIEDGLVTRVLDDGPENPLGSAPLWLVGERVLPYLSDLPGPPYETAQAFQRAIDDGARIAGIEIGRTRDITFPPDLVEENFPYLRSLS
jgi:UDP-N-acetylglucosamine diphosphorylase / glucose-1-phosphate thymidylyltransferase / UDP-N-acetylgalactosamine diphosphorylase / glucosamine-1-phosphate N-acetyltransferase / galactosamine-1-phosphate N-acetyltransferase